MRPHTYFTKTIFLSFTLALGAALAGCAGADTATDEDTNASADELSTSNLVKVRVVRTGGFFAPGPKECMPNSMALNVAFASSSSASIEGTYCSTNFKQTTVAKRALTASELADVKDAIKALKVVKAGPIAPDAANLNIDITRKGKPSPKTTEYTDSRNPALGRIAVDNGAELADTLKSIVAPTIFQCQAMPACQVGETPIDPKLCLTATGIECVTHTMCGHSITCSKPLPPVPGKKGGMCGGFAGIPCDPGLTCTGMAPHPDASGICK